ncbi:hypothetical protein NLZ15_18415 [Atlantibacter subterranea]|uniref:hypothetical protein n=1 Tax=Atlantibacter subterraneus TaxID=255519 RepID=UPI0020C23A83|nr:hypothetical protein [Atlantibacter subterranea]UTJ46777.1 hypothetical protein NLZ15_18415 [Atlantibacter subterranea]
MQSTRPCILTAGIMLLALLLIFTAFHTERRLTWLLKMMPLFVIVPVLWITARRYPLTPLLYSFIFIGCVSLILGKDADDFLGTQADMLCALPGSIFSVLIPGRWHSR